MSEMHTEKMNKILKALRREIEDETDWNNLYGLSDEIQALAELAEERLVELNKEGG